MFYWLAYDQHFSTDELLAIDCINIDEIALLFTICVIPCGLENRPTYAK